MQVSERVHTNRQRELALWFLDEGEREDIRIEDRTGLPSAVWSADKALEEKVEVGLWKTDLARQHRFLSILDDLEECYKDTPYARKEITHEDRLYERLADFLSYRLALSPEWTSERLKLYAKDLSLLVKWSFYPRDDRKQKLVAVILKKRWAQLVDTHHLSQDRRQPVRLAEQVRAFLHTLAYNLFYF